MSKLPPTRDLARALHHEAWLCLSKPYRGGFGLKMRRHAELMEAAANVLGGWGRHPREPAGQGTLVMDTPRRKEAA